MNQIDQIKAEIERRRRDVEQQRPIRHWGKSYYVVMSELLDIIANLPQEQPEVDLAKEVESWMKKVPSVNLEWNNIADAMRDCARHFYELGLNARKEAPNDSVCEGYECEEYEAFTTGNVTGIRIKQKPSEDLEEAAENEFPCEKWMTDEMLDLNGRMQFAFRKGAQWQKEQMLKGAVEKKVLPAEIIISGNHYLFPAAITIYGSKLSSRGLESGDKVKVIIVKEEKKH